MKKLILIALFSLSSCAKPEVSSLINTSHLDHLYEEVIVNSDTLGIIHIYSEYPDYHWVDDGDEGTACIDDAARAMIFYLKHYTLTQTQPSLLKTKKLLNFLFYMQADNGYFYNFIWKDNSINRTYKTSVAEPNWWSWRALWALAEANSFFKDKDKQLSGKITFRIKKLISAASSWLKKDTSLYAEYSGIKTPMWLPYESAGDQAAIILKGLSVYFQLANDSSVIPMIESLSSGIIHTQAGSDTSFPYNAFLSWQNTWHAWGNSQADALLSAGKVLHDSACINAALKEIKYFYPFLVKEKYYSNFILTNKMNLLTPTETNRYPQIAYGFRPMIFAAVNAFEITNDPAYASIALSLVSWFFGDNINSAQMYSAESGRCYDGIVNEKKINMNSGAESTIEALLSLVKIEQNKDLKEQLLRNFK